MLVVVWFDVDIARGGDNIPILAPQVSLMKGK